MKIGILNSLFLGPCRLLARPPVGAQDRVADGQQRADFLARR